MIGFEDELERPGPFANEGPETRNLEKPGLHEMVGTLKFLPPYGSRACRRKYLISVHSGEAFSVNHSALRHFEVDLETSMMKKMGVVNNGLLVRKLNMLLESKGLPKIGFSEYEPPEQVGQDHSELALPCFALH